MNKNTPNSSDFGLKYVFAAMKPIFSPAWVVWRHAAHTAWYRPIALTVCEPVATRREQTGKLKAQPHISEDTPLPSHSPATASEMLSARRFSAETVPLVTGFLNTM